nr:hypothetical protein [Terrabacter sp. Soil811]
MDASAVVEPFMNGMRLLATGVPGGYQKVGRGVVLNVIGLPSASTNTIHVRSPDAERDDAEAYADELAGADLPFVVRERPGAPSWVGDLAAQRGLSRRADFPIMVMDEPTILTLTAGPREDVDAIVELDGDALDLLPRVAEAFALGNELPRGLYDPLVGRPMVDSRARRSMRPWPVGPSPRSASGCRCPEPWGSSGSRRLPSIAVAASGEPSPHESWPTGFERVPAWRSSVRRRWASASTSGSAFVWRSGGLPSPRLTSGWSGIAVRAN